MLILEEYAEEIKKLLGIQIDIYGFDRVKGLAKPKDYRDLPICGERDFLQWMNKN